MKNHQQRHIPIIEPTKYNHALNAVVLGYALALIALGLNVAAGSKLGVVLAVGCMTCAYLNECFTAKGQGRAFLEVGMLGFAVASYLCWLLV